MFPELSNMLSWWQWALLAAVPPAIVLLYFLKLKRRPLEVPSTYLWHKSVEDLHVNSIWQRLRNNLLLYLQLLVVLLIVLALLRPSWHALHLAGGRLVLLIDNSASMQATDVKPSRLEEAKRLRGRADRPNALRRLGDADQLLRQRPRGAELHRQPPAAPRGPGRDQAQPALDEPLRSPQAGRRPGQSRPGQREFDRYPRGRARNSSSSATAASPPSRTSSWATWSRPSSRSASPTPPTWASWPLA